MSTNKVASPADQPVVLPFEHPRPPLEGGWYTKDEALLLLNFYFVLGLEGGNEFLYRIGDDRRSVTLIKDTDFRRSTMDMHVQVGVNKRGDPVWIPAPNWWLTHANRRRQRFVFKPHGDEAAHEFNLWRGFAVTPLPGHDKMHSFIGHLGSNICRGDQTQLNYLLGWMAWKVQNPDLPPETVLVFKSKLEGTGKSFASGVMRHIFGHHGEKIDNKERLVGRFTDWLVNACFLQCEEIMFAGDHNVADRLKSLVTGDTLQVERKNGPVFQTPNRLGIWMTTNHEWAVPAGYGNRRFVVFEVNDDRLPLDVDANGNAVDVGKVAQNHPYFAKIQADLEAGGYGQLLNFLLTLDLKGWHPRKIITTKASVEQEQMSADSMEHWQRASEEQDAIVGHSDGDLEWGWHPYQTLWEAYTGYCRQASLRPINDDLFSKRMARQFEKSKRHIFTDQSLNGKGPRRNGYTMVARGEVAND
jgi:hypothetical protein